MRPRADEAAAAAHVLAGEGTENATYTLTGTEAFSVNEVAAMVREATGKPLEVVNVSEDQLAAGMKAGGLPEFMIPMVVSFDTAARNGHLAKVTDDIGKLTGRNPPKLKAFLEQNRQALTG